jgi:hypothetical protein
VLIVYSHYTEGEKNVNLTALNLAFTSRESKDRLMWLPFAGNTSQFRSRPVVLPQSRCSHMSTNKDSNTVWK